MTKQNSQVKFKISCQKNAIAVRCRQIENNVKTLNYKKFLRQNSQV